MELITALLVGAVGVYIAYRNGAFNKTKKKNSSPAAPASSSSSTTTQNNPSTSSQASTGGTQTSTPPAAAKQKASNKLPKAAKIAGWTMLGILVLGASSFLLWHGWFSTGTFWSRTVPTYGQDFARFVSKENTVLIIAAIAAMFIVQMFLLFGKHVKLAIGLAVLIVITAIGMVINHWEMSYAGFNRGMAELEEKLNWHQYRSGKPEPVKAVENPCGKDEHIVLRDGRWQTITARMGCRSSWKEVGPAGSIILVRWNGDAHTTQTCNVPCRLPFNRPVNFTEFKLIQGGPVTVTTRWYP
jgi:hypothetical protein